MNSTLVPNRTARTQPLTPAEKLERRRLIFQDALALLGLTALSLCIAVLTYFFFRSFREHRSVLEKRWFARGELALAAGQPQFAVEDFRSALALSAANPKYELALAEALTAANRNEEAYAYFSSLHDAEPGDGFLNLQLARLAVKRKHPNEAVSYYRSALTGLWHGQGARQRFEIRVELAKYLMSLGRNTEAQGELLTAEGNSLDHPADLLEIADLLRRAGDVPDAWTTYRRVEVQPGATPAQVIEALRQEANVALSMGQYKRAAQAMERYVARARSRRAAVSEADRHEVAQQLERVRRMIQLIPFYGLSPAQRAERVMSAAQIAHARYVGCSASLQHAGAVAPNLSADDAAALTALDAQWQQMSQEKSSQLAGDPAGQKAMLDWVNRTENLTARLCGPPSGDDALLLELAQVPDKSE